MTRHPCLWFGVAALIGSACADPEEPARVELDVVADASGLVPVETNLGYQVELTEARVIVEDLTFATAGELHTAWRWRSLTDWVIPSAHAHPGHYQGGDITGELRGHFVVSWLPTAAEPLGRATLLVGSYESVNFTFAHAAADDGLASDDPLSTHTALLRGQAARDGSTVDFVATIDSPIGRELVGAAFQVTVTETSPTRLAFRFLTRDTFEGDTLFDDLDFLALDGDGDGQLAIAPEATDEALVAAYDQLRRTFQTHDHFDVRALQAP